MTLRAVTAILLVLAASPSRAQNYCAQFSDGTSPDCGFSTLQECLASVSGIGGVCMDSPYGQSPSMAPPPLPLPPGQTNYQLFPATPPGQQALSSQPPSSQPPCNPVIDGTHCATAGGGILQPTTSMPAIQSLSSDLMGGGEPPATLGGINISEGATCMGLFRRMACGG